MVNKQYKFGVVQGRLTVPPHGQLQWFPQHAWAEEFKSARDAGIDFIELLSEREHNSGNPLWSSEGRGALRAVSAKSGQGLYSSCLDYIIDHSLLDDPEGLVSGYVSAFIEASADLGCKVVIMPLLEQSDLNDKTCDQLVPILKAISQLASKYQLEVCVESLLSAKPLSKFLVDVDEANIKCVFDTGNRAIAQPDLGSEILALGSAIGHVHIKDKNRLGENVVLGRGLVDFFDVFSALKKIEYSGPLVFETTRGVSPLETIRFHKYFCEFFVSQIS